MPITKTSNTTIHSTLQIVAICALVIGGFAAAAGFVVAATTLKTSTRYWQKIKQRTYSGTATVTVSASADVVRSLPAVVVSDCIGASVPASCEKSYQDTTTYRTVTTAISGLATPVGTVSQPIFFNETYYFTDTTYKTQASVAAAGAKEYTVSTSRVHTWGDDHTTTETIAGETIPSNSTATYPFKTVTMQPYLVTGG